MLGNWFKNYAAVQVDGAVTSAIEAIVRFDPKGASEAELRSMEDRLDGIGRKVSEAQVSYEREKREADEFRTRYEGRLKALGILKAKAEAEQDPAQKAKLADSYTKFYAETQDLKANVKLEIDDEVKTKALLDSLQGAYRSAAEKLKGARATLERANRNRADADQRLDAAREREQAAREAAGLSKASNGVNVALQAMEEAAERSRAQANVLDDKAKLLTPTDLAKDDENIAAAMREASGAKPGPSLDSSIDDLRL